MAKDILDEAEQTALEAQSGSMTNPDADWPHDAVVKVVRWVEARAFAEVAWLQESESGQLYRVVVIDTGEARSELPDSTEEVGDC